MSVVDATAPVLPGETLAGKYRVERVLGKGGMGVVVAARHLDLDERVAIKFLLRKGDPVALERFVREARAAAKVKSEHVCRVHDVGRLDTGEPYLVMEYLEGADLAAILAREGKLPIERAAALVIEACLALSDAHALGIVHRDLKPANLFVATRPNGTQCLKVLDFGISKLPDVEAMTTTSATMGSPAYMSPEQIASSRDVDARADVWSLGVILYELVTGALPFAAESLIQLTVKIRESDAPPASSVEPTVPPAFASIIARCLERAPDGRFPSAAALAEALAPFAGGRAASPLAQSVMTLGSSGVEKPEPEPRETTLEPLSRADHVEPRGARWKAVAAAAIALAGVLLASRRCDVATREPPIATATADVSVAPSAPSAPSASSAPSATASGGSLARPPASADTTSISTPSPKRARPTVHAIKDAGVATPTFVSDAGKHHRTLDRSDPYE